MAHIVTVVAAFIFTILFELFTLLFFSHNCEKVITYKNNIKICVIFEDVIFEETFANAFVNNNSIKNNDTIIFITKKLYEEIESGNISKEEFEAIIQHELNHIRKNHLLFIPLVNFIIPFVFLLFVIEVFVVIFKSVLTRKYSILEFVLLLVLFALNHLINYSVNIFVKKIEFEADNIKDNYKEHLAKALLKLSKVNNAPIYLEGKSHPSVERRIKRLLEER